MIGLIELYLKREDKDCYYNNRFTGTCFDIDIVTGSAFDTEIDGDQLKMAVKGSNDWRDWIRNTIQLFGIIGSIYLIKNGMYFGIFTLVFSCIVHLGFFFAGLEVFIQLIKLKFWRFKYIFGHGHSLGGTAIQWIAIFMFIFGFGKRFKAITTGSPKILSIFAPLFWFRKEFNVINYINPRDKVPETPPKIFGFIKHIGKTELVKPFGDSLIEWHNVNTYYQRLKNEI